MSEASFSIAAMVYLDYNATAPPDFDLIEDALAEYRQLWGNPSSVNAWGQKSKARIEDIRSFIEGIFELPGRSLTFCSSGSEAIYSMVYGWGSASENLFAERPLVITSAFEHPAMEAALRSLEPFGARLHYLPVNETGQTDTTELEDLLDHTACISILLAQNESGIIQPLNQILNLRDSYEKQSGHYIPVFSDTIQAVGKMPFTCSRLDGMTIAGHKLGSGIQSSAFYRNAKLPGRPLFSGGNQEHERRAGTENILGILSLERIFKDLHTRDWPQWQSEMSTLQKNFEAQLTEISLVEEIIGQNNMHRLPTVSFLRLKPGCQPDFLLMYLDQNGITASNGTSCKSRSRTESTTLIAMGYNNEQAAHRLRISWGSKTTADELQLLVEALKDYNKSLS